MPSAKGLRLGVLSFDDLMTEDAIVLSRLDAPVTPQDRPEAEWIRISAAGSHPRLHAKNRPQGTLARSPGPDQWRGERLSLLGTSTEPPHRTSMIGADF